MRSHPDLEIFQIHCRPLFLHILQDLSLTKSIFQHVLFYKKCGQYMKSKSESNLSLTSEIADHDQM